MSISTKLVSLVEDLTTPLTIKAWLVPLFEHMTHDATVSMKVSWKINARWVMDCEDCSIGSSIIGILNDE